MQTYEKFRKQPSSRSWTEMSKAQFYPVSIVNYEKKGKISTEKRRNNRVAKKLLLHMEQKEFSDELAEDKNYRHIRNHYHYTRKYRGAWPSKDIFSRP